MGEREIIWTILLFAPAYGAMQCGLLLLRFARRKDSLLPHKALVMITLSYSASAFTWLSVLLSLQVPGFFILVSPLMSLSIMLIFVFSYHFVFEVTKIRDNEKLPPVHYLIPLLIFSAILLWSFLVPSEERLSLAESPKLWMYSGALFPALFLSIFAVLLLFNLFYSIKILISASRYRKAVVNFSADEQRGSVQWLNHLAFTTLAITPVVAGVFFTFGAVMIIFVFVLGLLAIFKYAILLHNIMLENFVLMGDPGNGETPEVLSSAANRERLHKLETYMRREKPYLNSKLKITDIIADLHTNRTSLSILINRNYGMNFCRYVNRQRLEELEKLRHQPANTNLPEADLVLLAGFSDWRGYQRVKKRETILL